jgi:hypothetical protein
MKLIPGFMSELSHIFSPTNGEKQLHSLLTNTHLSFFTIHFSVTLCTGILYYKTKMVPHNKFSIILIFVINTGSSKKMDGI